MTLDVAKEIINKVCAEESDTDLCCLKALLQAQKDSMEAVKQTAILLLQEKKDKHALLKAIRFLEHAEKRFENVDSWKNIEMQIGILSV